MNFGILGNPDGWYVRELQRVATDRGHRTICVDFRTLAATIGDIQTKVSSQGEALHQFDALLVRTMPPGSLEQVVYRMDVLQRLQSQGVLILNSPKAIETAVDKFLTSAKLAAAGLPTPRTIVCETADDACEAFARLGGDVVVKPLFGSEGRGILRVSDPDLAFRTFRTLERTQSVLYLQEFIPHDGSDLRVLVLDGQVVGAFRRRHPSDFRTNVARDGLAEAYEVNSAESSLALQAAEAVGACFAGIDLMYDPRQTDPQQSCMVIEANAVPGWKAFQATTGIDVATRVIEYVENACHGSE